MMARFFAPLAIKIFSAVTLALVVAVAVIAWRADSISNDRDKLRTDLSFERANHAITRQSVATLEQRLSAMIDAGKVTRQAVEDAVTETKQETDAMRAEAAKIGAVKASGAETPQIILESDL